MSWLRDMLGFGGNTGNDDEMSKEEMVRRTRESLEAFDRLPVEVRIKKLVDGGTIDINGNVLMGGDDGPKV